MLYQLKWLSNIGFVRKVFKGTESMVEKVLLALWIHVFYFYSDSSLGDEEQAVSTISIKSHIIISLLLLIIIVGLVVISNST
jgi:hypothetical protein